MHKKMITNKDDISVLFSVFHDGSIIFDKKENTDHYWKIECQYLAEKINPAFGYFRLKVVNCKHLQFIPWMDPEDLPQEYWNTPGKIFQADLEILSAKVKDDKVEICCNQHDPAFNFCGGVLVLDCGGILVFDQAGKELEFEELKTIAKTYWNSK